MGRLSMMTRKAPIIHLLAMLVALTITSSLGFWQLSRAAQKQELARDQLARQALPAVSLNGAETAKDAEALKDRRVQLRGQWLPQATVYLDNRQMEGRPGFWVMTPLLLADSRQAVVVQRGWVPRNFQNRQALPPIDTPEQEVMIEGRLASHAAKLFDLGAQSAGQIRQNLDLQAYAHEIRRPVLPFVVVQSGADSGGLKRQWPAVDSGVDKHYGYAFQWFGLSALWVILYVWFQIIVPRKQRASA